MVSSFLKVSFVAETFRTIHRFDVPNAFHITLNSDSFSVSGYIRK